MVPPKPGPPSPPRRRPPKPVPPGPKRPLPGPVPPSPGAPGGRAPSGGTTGASLPAGGGVVGAGVGGGAGAASWALRVPVMSSRALNDRREWGRSRERNMKKGWGWGKGGCGRGLGLGCWQRLAKGGCRETRRTGAGRGHAAHEVRREGGRVYLRPLSSFSISSKFRRKMLRFSSSGALRNFSSLKVDRILSRSLSRAFSERDS